mmetsp:Transcript_17769/g.30085  ORF Transcript_17769/g.30085 Transcript_17769/m.30085 type:complete len:177 (+) Transcript_17769:312-842(+)
MEGYQPAFVYPFAVNGLLAITQVIMVVYGHKYSDRLKIQLGYFVASLIFLSLPFASHYGQSPGSKFYTCFFILFFFGFVSGVVQGQVFGLASIMPPKFMGAVMFGNGVSGILMNVLRAILQLALPGVDQAFKVALIFFILAAAILLVCSLSFSVLNNSEFFQYYKKLSENPDLSKA